MGRYVYVCEYCFKTFETRVKRYNSKHFFCSKKCYSLYVEQQMISNNKKLSYSGIEVYHPETIYEQFVYKYYRKILFNPDKSKMKSDAWYCFAKMLDEEGINDTSAFFRAIRRYAYRLQMQKYYEITESDLENDKE